MTDDAAMADTARKVRTRLAAASRAVSTEVRGFARDLAEKLALCHPDQLTAALRKEARKGRLYLDVQRNGRAQTAVAPYAVRARAGASLAAPHDVGRTRRSGSRRAPMDSHHGRRPPEAGPVEQRPVRLVARRGQPSARRDLTPARPRPGGILDDPRQLRG